MNGEEVDATDVDGTDVDPAELRDDLDQIKTAMGIEERYPGQGTAWLVYAAIVGGFSFALQFLFLVPLPEWAYVATWIGFVAVSVGSVWLLARRTSRQGTSAAPALWVIPATLGLLLVVLSTITQVLGTVSAVPGIVLGAYYFAMVIALAGVGFVLAGNALRAHRIRRRDRWVFYAGGAWMLAYAAVFPHTEALLYSGYGVFGILSLVHAVVSYYALTRG